MQPCAFSRTSTNRYPDAWSRYGFVNAFNPLKNWYDTDVIGIDTGVTMVMAENARSGFVWDTFMKNPEAQHAMNQRRLQTLQPHRPASPIKPPESGQIPASSPVVIPKRDPSPRAKTRSSGHRANAIRF